MQFPSRDFTNQYISKSYQDVVQRYADTGSTTYFLDGLGYVIAGIPTSSIGNIIVTQDQTASYSFFAITASYAATSSVTYVTSSITSSVTSAISASWASSSISASYFSGSIVSASFISTPNIDSSNSYLYSSGKFVATIEGSHTAVYSLNGINWNVVTMPGDFGWDGLIYGNGKYVAVAYYNTNGSASAYSYDGIHWSSSIMPGGSSLYWASVAYGNGKYVAVADNFVNTASYSSDGINWSASVMPDSLEWYSVCYGNDKFVAVTYDGSNTSSYSYDGIHWTASVMPGVPPIYWTNVCYGNGKFVVVPNTSNTGAYSYDGIHWTASVMPGIYCWNSVIYGNGKFVTVEDSGDIAAYSYDGITWYSTPMPLSGSGLFWIGVAYGNGKFVAIADTPDTAYSYDGVNWTASVMPVNLSGWFNVVYGNNDGNNNSNNISIDWQNQILSDGLWKGTIFNAISSSYANISSLSLVSDVALIADTASFAGFTTEPVIHLYAYPQPMYCVDMNGTSSGFKIFSGSDCSPMIQAAINDPINFANMDLLSGSVPVGSKLVFAPGTYNCNSPISFSVPNITLPNSTRGPGYPVNYVIEGAGKFNTQIIYTGTNAISSSNPNTASAFITIGTTGQNDNAWVNFSAYDIGFWCWEQQCAVVYAIGFNQCEFNNCAFGNSYSLQNGRVAGSSIQLGVPANIPPSLICLWADAGGDNALIVENHCIFSGGAIGLYLNCDHARIVNSDFGGFGQYNTGSGGDIVGTSYSPSSSVFSLGSAILDAVRQEIVIEGCHMVSCAGGIYAIANPQRPYYQVPYHQYSYNYNEFCSGFDIGIQNDWFLSSVKKAQFNAEQNMFYNQNYGSISSGSGYWTGSSIFPSYLSLQFTQVTNAGNGPSASLNLWGLTNIQNGVIIGSLTGTSSWSNNSTSSSYAITASWAPTPTNVTSCSYISSSTIDSGNGLLCLATSQSMFVSVTNSTFTSSYSYDGINWTASIMPAPLIWSYAAYGNKKFVAVSNSSSTSSYSYDGINWTASAMPASLQWDGITYGNGTFVAVAYNSNVGAYSYDGINWISSSMPATLNWQSVAYGNGVFVTVAVGSNTGSYSSDGINWTASAMPASLNWQNITYGNGKFVIVAYNSISGAYSYDGINWTSSTMPLSRLWESVTYGNGTYVAVARNSLTASYSSDGINWTSSRMPASLFWSSVTYGNGKFVAVTINTATSSYSSDGINWTSSKLPASLQWINVTNGFGKTFYVPSIDWQNNMLADGIWTGNITNANLATSSISSLFASQSLSASWASSSISSSYAITASWAPMPDVSNSSSWASSSISSSYAITASYAPFTDNPNATSSSWASSSISSSWSNISISSSYALSASWAPGGGSSVSASWASSSLGDVPVGCVVAWLQNLSGTPALPSNFVQCNGQTITDPQSPYSGSTISNLNGSGAQTQRFLRGSTTSGGTGGSDTNTHYHNITFNQNAAGSSPCSANGSTDNTTISILPSYYEVVWVLRIK
jgi:hypothetical protein